LFGVAFISVVRDGIELALFITALEFSTGEGQTLLGTILGLVTSALLGWLLFTSTRRLPLQRFFQVTNILLILFAAGLVAHGVHEFVEVGWIPAVVDPIYNINFLVNSDSGLGQLLKALFGYNGSPTLAESLAYLVYFLVLVYSLTRNQNRPMVKAV
jgi:high-affinity iron transporter